MSAGINHHNHHNDSLWQTIARCFLSLHIGKKSENNNPPEEMRDSFETEVCDFIAQAGKCNENEAKQWYLSLLKDVQNERATAGTIPVVLQVCSGIGFLAGVINGTIMMTTGLHPVFVFSFAVSVLVACAPLFYRHNHRLEYTIVGLLRAKQYHTNEISSVLKEVYKEIQR